MDFTIIGKPQDTVLLVRPENDRARTWAKENIAPDAQEFGGGIAVENRYLDPLVIGILDAGFIIRVEK